MELDLTGIHKLAAEQGIDPETLDHALAEALRLAYLKTPHAAKHARVELDERSGNHRVGRRRNSGRTHRRQPLPRSQAGRGIR